MGGRVRRGAGVLAYELALELGLRSTDLVARAHELGMDGVGPSSNLTPEDVARLRAAIRGVPEPPLVAPGEPGSFGAGRGYQAPVGPGRPAPPGMAPVPGSDVISEPMSAASKAVIGGVVALVVALFAYMAVNTGSDGPKRTEAVETADDGAPTTTEADPCAEDVATSTTAAVCADVEGGLVGAPATSSTTRPEGYVPGVDDPRDVRKFCKGARSAMELERKLAQVTTAEQFRDAIVAGRAQWMVDAALMDEGAPPRIDVSMDLYMATYGNLMATVTPASDEQALMQALIRIRQSDISHAAIEINGAFLDNCSGR